MFCPTGQVVVIHSEQVDKTRPSTLILALSQSWLLWYIRVDMESICPEFALYDSKNECARTDTVFFHKSEVCTRGVTLWVVFYHNLSVGVLSHFCFGVLSQLKFLSFVAIQVFDLWQFAILSVVTTSVFEFSHNSFFSLTIWVFELSHFQFLSFVKI